MSGLTRTLAVAMLALLLAGGGLRPVQAQAEQPAVSEPLPVEQLRIFADVFGRIKQDYVEEIDDATLLNYAIRGMLAGLDPHSAYLDEESFKEVRIGTSGQFGGLGIEVGMEGGLLKVIAPIDDTPAQRAGIQAGDLIIRLDDTLVNGLTLNEAIKLMRGEPGEEIVLTIVREGTDQPFRVPLTRAVISVKSVRERLLEDTYGYVRISQFRAQTGANLGAAIARLKADAGGSLKGLVLDLRNNPGGVLNAAVEVSDAFLDGGLIVYTEGRVSDSKQRFSAASGDLLEGAPLVVLINGGSASASEIVAGALQDHKRAVLLGSPTFGKGSVQTIMPLDELTALKLTTARYFTPAGRSIQAEGIVPDIELGRLRLTALEGHDPATLKEADLSRHLSNGNREESAEPSTVRGTPAARPIIDDYPLNEALNLLKGMHLLQQQQAARHG